MCRTSNIEEEMKQLEEMLKAKSKNIRKLSEEIIPAKMQELGLESLTLKDGSAVKVKQKVQASIPVRHRETAFQWLRDNGHGDLIKNQISASSVRVRTNQLMSLLITSSR